MTTTPTLAELLRAAHIHPVLPPPTSTATPLARLNRRIERARHHTSSAPPLSEIDGAILQAQELVHAPHDEPLYDQEEEGAQVPSLIQWLTPPPPPAPALTAPPSAPRPPQRAAPEPSPMPAPPTAIAQAMLDALRRRPLSGIMRAQVAKLLAQGVASKEWWHVEEALGLLLTGQMSQGEEVDDL